MIRLLRSKVWKCKSRAYYIIDHIKIDHKIGRLSFTCRSFVEGEGIVAKWDVQNHEKSSHLLISTRRKQWLLIILNNRFISTPMYRKVDMQRLFSTVDITAKEVLITYFLQTLTAYI